jgi:hypothetical protein
MATTVSADGRPGAPMALFPANTWTNFDVMENGARFVAIVQQSVGYEQPLTVLLNWQPVMRTR